MSRYNIPRKFSGENRILYIFTKKSFIYTAIGSGIGLLFLSIFTSIGYPAVGILALLIIAGPFYIFGAFKYPKDIRYNAGEDLDRVVLRKLKRLLNKRVYVTEYKRGEP